MRQFFVNDSDCLGIIRYEIRKGLSIRIAGPFSTSQKVSLTHTVPSGLDQRRTGKIVCRLSGSLGEQTNRPGTSQ